MKDSTNPKDPKSNVDRIAVCVTWLDVDKVPGICKILSGTGQAQTRLQEGHRTLPLGIGLSTSIW